MRRSIVLLSLIAGSVGANAQVTLSGTSYTQDFSQLGLATPVVPTGWFGYTGATSSAAGTLATISTSKTYGVFADTVSSDACKANVWNDDFKNYPSANGGMPVKVATCAAQPGITDRALGVRQKSNSATPPFWDPGAAFVFKVANTTGRTNFNLTFKLQSLDTTSPRTTTWAVDYGIGTNPTSFTPVSATGTMTTGGLTFSNNTVSVNFGSALDNQSSVVWIRVVALTASTGGGNRASSAIDDVNLTWTGSVSVDEVNTQAAASMAVYGMATSDKVIFGYNVESGLKYGLSIHDITGRKVYDGNFTTNASGTYTLNGLNLVPGLYIARMNNGNTTAVTKFSVN
ncbi:hypothetical protein GCM10023093_01960 [Nemorincola caseinilytica]|uniref:T9SS C-terminal target domain-containing protein n=1 Tax=Nemorincola caseinilytica TaxID=2054315 RepID=A0ABP8N258_9BACT